eukprot:Rhum_TRINITY_DN14533_c24_g2::Rhum_TRINITY_DN14533_c24_g2_i1::g.99099::m.99099/K03248/EIF3G; translation initiation factor 3 subunit G
MTDKKDEKLNNWADMMDEDPAAEDQYETITPGQEEKADTKILRDGTKVITEVVSKDGGKFKVEKRVRVVKRDRKVFKAAEERKARMVNFGNAATGNYPEMVVISDPVRLEIGKQEEISKSKMESEIQKMVQKVSNAAAAGGQSTFKASKRSSDEKEAADAEKKGNVFVARGGGHDVTAATDGGRPQRDDRNTVRITNLSEDISDDDLHLLFRKYGQITRSYIAVDRNTSQRRGFGFITFKTREEAAAAIAALDRHPLKHVILEVGWAQPQKQ